MHPHNLPRRTRIKICGLTREEDVLAAACAGVDAVGFVLYSASPRCVTAARAAELAALLPPFVSPVLLCVNPQPDDLKEVLQHVPQAWLQFHGDESLAQCQALAQGHPFLRALRMPAMPVMPSGSGMAVEHPNTAENAGTLPIISRDVVSAAVLQDYASGGAVLLDTHVPGYGGAGKQFNWSLLPKQMEVHVVLAGGLRPDNVGTGIHLLRGRCKSLGVDVSSGVETSPGVKDALKIQAFVQAVRQADCLC